MVKQIYRGFTKVEQGQILQPEVFGFDPNLAPYPYDPAKAKLLLAQAGYPNGFKSKIEAYYGSRPETKDIGLLIQSQLRDVGIEADYNPIADFAVWSDKFYGKTDRRRSSAPESISFRLWTRISVSSGSSRASRTV
jgi:ABC-type transport system substrate-binding protein